jgi:hypothetical protein
MNYRNLIAALLMLPSSAAISAELPISGAYGSDYACDLYTSGGINAVSAGNSKMAPDFDFRFLVVRDGVATVGHPVCAFTNVEDSGGGRFLVDLDCDLRGNDGWNYFFLVLDGETAEVGTDDGHSHSIRRCETSVSLLQGASSQ